tara:strand:+ start:43998 stop:45422 length:1425 start_codon:yes stop_codon:yes gene_type:complete
MKPNSIKSNLETDAQSRSNIYSYLDSHKIKYEVIKHAKTFTLEQAATVCQIPRSALLRTVVLEEEHGMIMAILPMDRLLDFSSLCKALNRDMVPAKHSVVSKLFTNCDPGSYPPLPDFFKVDAILDRSIMALDIIYFEPGQHDTLIKMQRDDFVALQRSTWQGEFSSPISYLTEGEQSPDRIKQQVDQFTPQRFQARLQENIDLPAIPVVATEILQLRSDLNATASSLADIVVKDPSLSAQLIKWAQSPFYGYSGKITSIECAIIKVLGFDLVLNLSLGIALNRAMKIPVDGPLGLKAYWKFSIYTAILSEALVKRMPVKKRPIVGLVYLSGLLHNFGNLLLAELFPPQYFILNRYIEVNPNICLIEIEKHVLGVTHTQIGAWLLETWGLPQEVLAAVKGHHEEDYVGQYAEYSNLIYVATRLLKMHNLGDAQDYQLSASVLESLGLSLEDAQLALYEIMEKESELEGIVNQLT